MQIEVFSDAEATFRKWALMKRLFKVILLWGIFRFPIKTEVRPTSNLQQLRIWKRFFTNMNPSEPQTAKKPKTLTRLGRFDNKQRPNSAKKSRDPISQIPA